MYPNFQTGKIGITSSSFTSATWVEMRIGFVPELLELYQSSATSIKSGSSVVAVKYNFQDADSSSVVKKFWKLNEGSILSTSATTWEYTTSSTSYQAKKMDTYSTSDASSSSDKTQTTTVKRGFYMVKAHAAAWKNKTVRYIAWSQLGANMKDLSSIKSSSHGA